MTYKRFSRVSGLMVGIVLFAQIMGLTVLPGIALAASEPAVGKPQSAPATTPTKDSTPGEDAAAEGTATAPEESVGFIPLTDLPGLRDVANSASIPAFLNQIYKLCIGAAAVLAVLQIMRGGLTYMMGDSITEKKEARTLIVMSVVGLLLVLSPVIVFGLIDPRILNLNIGFSDLTPSSTSSASAPRTTASVCASFSENPENMIAVTAFVDGSLPSNASTWDYGPSGDACVSTCAAKIRSGSQSAHCGEERDPDRRNNLMYCDCRPSDVAQTPHRLVSIVVTLDGQQYTLGTGTSVLRYPSLSQCSAVSSATIRNLAGSSFLRCDGGSENYAACDAALTQMVNRAIEIQSVGEVTCAPIET